MTTADEARKEAEFLFWFLPKAKQPKVPEDMSAGEVAQMDDGRITFMALGPSAHVMTHDDGAGERYLEFAYGDANHIGEISPRKFQCPQLDPEVHVVGRAQLVKILSALTSDWVRFQFAGGLFVVDGMIGEKEAAAMLAPRVEDIE